jgi:hypothetical protein
VKVCCRQCPASNFLREIAGDGPTQKKIGGGGGKVSWGRGRREKFGGGWGDGCKEKKLDLRRKRNALVWTCASADLVNYDKRATGCCRSVRQRMLLTGVAAGLGACKYRAKVDAYHYLECEQAHPSPQKTSTCRQQGHRGRQSDGG